MPSLGDELVVRVAADTRHALSACRDGGEHLIGSDRALESILGSVPEAGRVILAQHDPDGQSLCERNAPAPAPVTARDEHLAGGFIPLAALEVGEMCHVLARPGPSRNTENA